jgi:hypothetical protein
MAPSGRRARGPVDALTSTTLRLAVLSAEAPSRLGAVDPGLGDGGAPVQRPAPPARRSGGGLHGAVFRVVGVESTSAVASDRSQDVEVAIAHDGRAPVPRPSVAPAATGDPVP